MYRVYLAGPEVFTRNPLELAEAKKTICKRYGFEGVFPLDNELNFNGLSKYEIGLKISQANEQLMQDCDLVIANMTPFRGPNTDSGTAFELGYMRALGKPVLAYANIYEAATGLDTSKHMNRVRTYYADKVPGRKAELMLRKESDTVEDSRYNMAVEDFDMVDNLMLDGAVYFSGHEVVVNPVPEEERYNNMAGFERCVMIAQKMMAAPTAE